MVIVKVLNSFGVQLLVLNGFDQIYWLGIMICF